MGYGLMHIVNSLSLVDVLRANVAPGATVLDVRSEIGVPAIPLAVMLPDRKFVLMERSTEKAAFLWKVMEVLGLAHVSLIHGDLRDGQPWPQGALHESMGGDVPEDSPVAFTVRASESIDVIFDIVDILPEGGLFLCHSGELVWKLDEEMFHVEHCEDAWTRSGDRRGSLHLFRFQG